MLISCNSPPQQEQTLTLLLAAKIGNFFNCWFGLRFSFHFSFIENAKLLGVCLLFAGAPETSMLTQVKLLLEPNYLSRELCNLLQHQAVEDPPMGVMW